MNSEHPKAVRHFQAAREILGTIKHPAPMIQGLDLAFTQLSAANARLARIRARQAKKNSK